jgi:YHS domain-containing protein
VRNRAEIPAQGEEDQVALGGIGATFFLRGHAMRFALICLLISAAPPAFAQSKRADLPKTHRVAEEQAAAKAAAAAGAVCPVTGRPINPEIWTDVEGKRVYFADEAARTKFLEDPGQYAEAMRAQWELMRPPRVQVLCPVTGKPVNPQISTLWNGERIYFATPEAKAAFEEQPQRYAGKLKDCYTFQTVCPCGYGEIRPDVSLEYKGRTLYFCCPGCREAFKRNPDAMMKQIDERIEANKRRWEQQHPATQPAAQTPPPSATP